MVLLRAAKHKYRGTRDARAFRRAQSRLWACGAPRSARPVRCTLGDVHIVVPFRVMRAASSAAPRVGGRESDSDHPPLPNAESDAGTLLHYSSNRVAASYTRCSGWPVTWMSSSCCVSAGGTCGAARTPTTASGSCRVAATRRRVGHRPMLAPKRAQARVQSRTTSGSVSPLRGTSPPRLDDAQKKRIFGAYSNCTPASRRRCRRLSSFSP